MSGKRACVDWLLRLQSNHRRWVKFLFECVRKTAKIRDTIDADGRWCCVWRRISSTTVRDTWYAYKALRGTARQNLEELIIQRQSRAVLTVLRTHGVIHANICLGEATATLWNNLPVNIRKCNTMDRFVLVQFFSPKKL